MKLSTKQMSGCYEAVVPTNIALIKYWGKKDARLQWPANDSLSLTLGDLATTTRAVVAPQARDHTVVLQGVALERGQAVADKAYRLLDRMAAHVPDACPLRIETSNNFPMGCGIASSASGLGALTLAALAAWTQAASWDELKEKGWERERIAHLARLGSGSACRSFWGGLVEWQAQAQAESQTVRQVFAPEHWQLADTVVLFSEQQKQVGSSAGHAAAWTSPLFIPRLAEVPHRLRRVKHALAERSMTSLGPLLEQEALEMHAVMMSATPATFYFGRETADFLAWLRRQRHEAELELYFTLDAGANVHVIGEQAAHGRLHDLVTRDFPQLRLLFAPVGQGPTLRRLDAGALELGL